jgi:hypothetical protein
MRIRRTFNGGRASLAHTMKGRCFTGGYSLVEQLEDRRLLSASIWDDTATPGTPAADDANSVEVGVRFKSDNAGYVTGIRFYKGLTNTGTHSGQLWSGSSLLGSVTFTNESASGWQEASFATPVHIDANTTYMASYLAPNGHYAVDNGYFAAAGVDNPPLHALADGIDGGNGAFIYTTVPTAPNQSFSSSNYWVDVLFDATLTPTVTGTSPQLQQTYVSPDVSPSVTFNVPMDPTSLNSGTLFLRGPGSVIVPATVSYDSVHRTATIDPTGSLTLNATYTIVVKGGAAGVKSAVGGNAMAADFTSTFRVQPVAPDSLFPTFPTPTITSADDAQSVEVGVRFQADTGGVITAMRFYKGAGNVGTHVGSIWNASDGSLVAQATFTNESAGGWQQLTFDSPVVITGGQTYIASYLAPTGHYAIDGGYFASAVNSGHLHAPADASGAGNGVFLYTDVSTFPTDSFDSSNYWVDVVYFAGPLQAANSPPTATSQTVNVNEDGVVTILLAGSDAESPSSDLTFRIDTLPTKGILKYNGVAVTAGQTFTGPPSNLTYTETGAVPAAGTTDSFTFTVIDPAGEASSQATLALNIASVNDRPVATPASVSVTEDGKVTIALAGSDEETAAAALKFRITSLPTKGILKYNGVAVTAGQTFTGSPANLTYEPGAETEGGTADSFKFVTIDAEGQLSDPATVSIAITKAVADGQVVLSGGILRIGGTADSDLITVSKTSAGKVRVTFGLRVVSESIALSSVSEIRVWGRGGCDGIALIDLSTKSMLSGGDGTDILAGSNGDDILLGGNDCDLLTGFGGNDVLAGGDGLDALLGCDGHDILIAGQISSQQTTAGLRAMGVEWAASKATSPTEATEADRVVTDNDFDLLSGGGGSDWFIVSRGDGVLDYSTRTGSKDAITYVS